MSIKSTVERAAASHTAHKTRLLLPFTSAIDPVALEYAAQMARNADAVLVALAVLPSGRQVRLEQVQAAQDFLAACECKARRYGLAVERHEIASNDAVGAISSFAENQRCETVLLFASRGSGVLLSSSELENLMNTMVCRKHIVQLASKAKERSAASTGFLQRWFRPATRLQHQQAQVAQSEQTARA